MRRERITRADLDLAIGALNRELGRANGLPGAYDVVGAYGGWQLVTLGRAPACGAVDHAPVPVGHGYHPRRAIYDAVQAIRHGLALGRAGITFGRMDWDDFARRYQPVPGGEFYEVCTSRALGKDDCVCYGHNTFPRDVPEERVWEILATTDDDPANTATFIYPYQCRYAINAIEAGMERIGFMVTEQPHGFANIEVEDRP